MFSKLTHGLDSLGQFALQVGRTAKGGFCRILSLFGSARKRFLRVVPFGPSLACGRAETKNYAPCKESKERSAETLTHVLVWASVFEQNGPTAYGHTVVCNRCHLSRKVSVLLVFRIDGHAERSAHAAPAMLGG